MMLSQIQIKTIETKMTMENKWKEYFKGPFSYDDYHIYWWVGNNMIMDSLDEEAQPFISAFNTVFRSGQPDGAVYTLSDDDPTVILRNGKAFLRMRGWGYLTGGCGLDYETAAAVQDSFIQYCLKKLNHEL